MIRLIRDLPSTEKREWLALFKPEVLAAPLPDDELWPTLVSVLKGDVLKVKPEADLPGALRRRLVEVAEEKLEIVESTDEMADMEIALAIVDFVLRVAVAARGDEELRAQLGVFFQTRPQSLDQTAGILVDAQEAIESAAEQGGGSFYNRVVAGVENASWDEFARDAGKVSPRVRLLQRTGATVAGASALGSAGAISGSGSLMAGSVWMSGGAVALFSPLALAVLGAGAGAGLLALQKKRKRDVAATPDEQSRVEGAIAAEASGAERTRLVRSRNSKMVQNVVRLCFMTVGQAGNAERARIVVLRYLEELGYQFQESEDGSIDLTAGSAKLSINFGEIDGRSLISISAHVHDETPGEEILAQLRKLNRTVALGRFAWDSESPGIDVNYQLLGDTLDIDELGFALVKVGQLADTADDELAKAMAAS